MSYCVNYTEGGGGEESERRAKKEHFIYQSNTIFFSFSDTVCRSILSTVVFVKQMQAERGRGGGCITTNNSVFFTYPECLLVCLFRL